eukprot:s2763_g13.t1
MASTVRETYPADMLRGQGPDFLRAVAFLFQIFSSAGMILHDKWGISCDLTSLAGDSTAQRYCWLAFAISEDICRVHRCRLMILATELGGPWHPDGVTFLRSLAFLARAVLAPLQAAAGAAWVAWWSALLACAAQRAYASLALQPARHAAGVDDGDAPLFSATLADNACAA